MSEINNNISFNFSGGGEPEYVNVFNDKHSTLLNDSDVVLGALSGAGCNGLICHLDECTSELCLPVGMTSGCSEHVCSSYIAPCSTECSLNCPSNCPSNCPGDGEICTSLTSTTYAYSALVALKVRSGMGNNSNGIISAGTSWASYLRITPTFGPTGITSGELFVSGETYNCLPYSLQIAVPNQMDGDPTIFYAILNGSNSLASHNTSMYLKYNSTSFSGTFIVSIDGHETTTAKLEGFTQIKTGRTVTSLSWDGENVSSIGEVSLPARTYLIPAYTDLNFPGMGSPAITMGYLYGARISARAANGKGASNPYFVDHVRTTPINDKTSIDQPFAYRFSGQTVYLQTSADSATITVTRPGWSQPVNFSADLSGGVSVIPVNYPSIGENNSQLATLDSIIGINGYNITSFSNILTGSAINNYRHMVITPNSYYNLSGYTLSTAQKIPYIFYSSATANPDQCLYIPDIKNFSKEILVQYNGTLGYVNGVRWGDLLYNGEFIGTSKRNLTLYLG